MRTASLVTVAATALLVAGGAACGEGTPKREIDTSKIEVVGATLRTDTVGGGDFTDNATFVLVDARNNSGEGAYVTLGGELVDEAKTAVGQLTPMSLWMPPGEIRTFALVDTDRKPRPTAKTARAVVRGASVFPAPLARIDDFHSFDDLIPGGKKQVVLQADLVNDADRDGTIMVVAVFYAGNNPLTRPFNVVKIKGKQTPETRGNCPDAGDTKHEPTVSRCPIRFIGPPGATRGVMFVADTVY